MDEFISILEKLAVQIVFDEAEHVLEKRVERLLIGSDHSHSDPGPLWKILVSDLGGRNLELVADAALETLHDHPLLFQSSAAGQMQVEDRVRNHHRFVESRVL